MFAKETKELKIKEIEFIKNQIKHLVPTQIGTVCGKYIIESELNLTMVDGKVCQALSKTPSAATCYLCGANSTEINILEKVKGRVVNFFTYEYGLSPLQAQLNFMKCILNISYRLEFCKLIASSKEYKEMKKKAET